MPDVLVVPVLTVIVISFILLFTAFSKLRPVDQIKSKQTPEEEPIKFEPVPETEKSKAEPKAATKKKVAKKVVRKRKRR